MFMYDKWHVKEIYRGECFRTLNQEQITEQTRLAQKAASEGKILEFYLGTYNIEDDEESIDKESDLD
ncbi:MAG: hypothetical protein JW779_03800 [Candidatus Thorarchaeota archaeon]|nr:hypothetical protein [Candidatus Thorarchaeota archaeon]